MHVGALSSNSPLRNDDSERATVALATAALKARIDSEPKPVAWRMRARVGDRRQWWTDVDEVR